MTTTLGSTSRSLIARVRAEDAAAWDRLVDLYGPLVLGWCRRSHLGEADVADVFQDVFRTVALRLEGFRHRGQGDSFRAWLRAVTRSRVVDHVRRRQREPIGAGGSSIQRRIGEVAAPEPPSSVARGPDASTRALLTRALATVRAQVRPNTFAAFQATAVDGRPTGDVAEELGMSVGAVRVAKCRVLQRLRTELGELSEG